MSKDKKISFLASGAPKAQAALTYFEKRFKNTSPEEADIIVSLGGDGFLLETLHDFIKIGTPIFPINCGSIGYLSNEYTKENILERIKNAEEFKLHPLCVEVEDVAGKRFSHFAINEAALVRMSRQAAHIRIAIDGEERIEKLMGDGVIVATTVGSTAYNFSAGGEVLPLESDLLALTAICAIHPRRWQGAVIHDSSVVELEIIDQEKRPVKAEMDFQEVSYVKKMKVYIDKNTTYSLLFDKDAGLGKKILNEQFPQSK